MVSKSAPNEKLFYDIIKNHSGHVLALLTRYLNEIDLAEDAMQDALESALKHWKKNGIPKNPQAWLFTTAKHKALDKLRRSKVLSIKLQQHQHLLEVNTNNPNEEDYTIPDERLRLIFTCCHPALKPTISIALTLKLLGGLSTKEIAKAFLVKTETLAQRIVRGKRKIKQTAIPYNIPNKEDFPERLDQVLMVLYLIFNQGYSSSNPEIPITLDFCQEAIRLTKALINLCPDEQEAKGLLALMLLHDSRKNARFDENGKYVTLEFQDRGLWNREQKQQGTKILESALRQKQIGSYQLQATISAIYSDAINYKSTNWQELMLVYDELFKINPSPVIKLNQLVVLAEIKPLKLVIEKINELEIELCDYQPFYAVKADVLARAGKTQEAVTYYTKAIELCENKKMKEFLITKSMLLR